jgi:hypothetical protein
VCAEDLSTHGIEFAGRHTWRNGIDHGIASLCDDPASTQEGVQFLLAVNSHV